MRAENRGYDIESKVPLAGMLRFIEVKGRARVGEVALSTNEYKTAERLRQDYWLYVVFQCANNPAVTPSQDPIQLGWEPLVKIEHYHIGASKLLNGECS